jgi:hypothetical protein
MPGFDRTGPQGQGPMTGGGFGYCGAGRRRGDLSALGGGYGRPGGGRGFGSGRGRGMARGRGIGRGYGRTSASGRGFKIASQGLGSPDCGSARRFVLESGSRCSGVTGTPIPVAPFYFERSTFLLEGLD